MRTLTTRTPPALDADDGLYDDVNVWVMGGGTGIDYRYKFSQ